MTTSVGSSVAYFYNDGSSSSVLYWNGLEWTEQR